MDTFKDIYERHQAAVFRFALFLTGNTPQAEDLTSDTFVRAWVARDRIRQASVRAYLLTITRNLHRDQVRASRRFVELDDRLPDERPGVDVRVEQHSFCM